MYTVGHTVAATARWWVALPAKPSPARNVAEVAGFETSASILYWKRQERRIYSPPRFAFPRRRGAVVWDSIDRRSAQIGERREVNFPLR
jgi:hypothetical protein